MRGRRHQKSRNNEADRSAAHCNVALPAAPAFVDPPPMPRLHPLSGSLLVMTVASAMLVSLAPVADPQVPVAEAAKALVGDRLAARRHAATRSPVAEVVEALEPDDSPARRHVATGAIDEPQADPTFHSVQYRDESGWTVALELLSNPSERLLLKRDGSLGHLAAGQPPGVYRRTDDAFLPMSAVELKRQLLDEYGRGYEVVSTPHFVIVQSRGRGDRWSGRFEASHHRFLAAMRSIGAGTQTGRFKMVAVVHPHRPAMEAELASRGFQIQNVAGLYGQDCNRIFTHDHGNPDYFEETLRHEAAHQSAFNCGIHSRLNATPRWITEGLGQWLEIDSESSSRHRMRIGVNAVSYQILGQNGCLDDPAALSRHLASIIRGDELFADPSTTSLAYAVAWAMTHHLANRFPDKLATVYRHTTARPPFVDYPADRRRADFSSIVDPNLDRYAVSLWRYLRALK